MIREEKKSDNKKICLLEEVVLGPGRYARPSFRLRENLEHNIKYSKVYCKGQKIVGSIRYFNCKIENNSGLMEKNFLQALKISPKQPEVLNYLAYSWLEKKINLDKAKEMLVEAVNLSKGRGYILDSLGWAYFLLKDFDKAEEILQTAYEKEPSEAVIYDHYGDVLWTNGKQIQARYVWQNAIKLKNIEQDLKESINKKIIFGLDDADKKKS